MTATTTTHEAAPNEPAGRGRGTGRSGSLCRVGLDRRRRGGRQAARIVVAWVAQVRSGVFLATAQ
jgi:hypothetical protein